VYDLQSLLGKILLRCFWDFCECIFC